MITQDKSFQIDSNSRSVTNATYFGLSTDSKPTVGVGNGSCFIEMNTGKIFFYDASVGGSGWLEWGANS